MYKNLRHLPIVLLLITALLVGFLTVKDYGESWDEADIYRYANYALNAYPYFFHAQDLPAFETNLNLYGPAYYMAADLAASAWMFVMPTWSRIDAWHFVYFLTFLGCALTIYLLAKRWMSELGAFGATLLFLSQPLFWGHAFVNPKDIPFMTVFTLSIYAGLKMTDHYRITFKLDATLVWAAIILGITMSFRIIGPLAGLIVLAYAAREMGWKAVPLAAIHIALAAVTAYATWPYLWSSLITHYSESIQTMSQFPFETNILFFGKLYRADQLPKTYFPTLTALQLTEPALVLIAIGIVLSAVQFFRKENRGPFALLLAWFFIPAVSIIGAGSPLYDNARQLYFLFPALFITAGIAFEKVFALLTHPAAKVGLLILAALPGILLGIRLHPYEYVYYNSLVGGTGGAFRKFEMDYWGISMKDLTAQLNASAAPNSRVLVFGPEQIVAQYARPDIRVFIPEEQPTSTYDYVAMLTRENLDLRRCKGANIIYSVGRRGAIFSVLKNVPDGIECQ